MSQNIDLKPIRVAHICQSHNPDEGGSLSVARALVREQRRIGIDARLVFLHKVDSSSERTLFGEDTLWCDIERRTRWMHGVVRLRSVLRRFDPSILHHHDGILWPRVVTMSLGRPIVTHGHLGFPTRGPFSSARLTQFVVKRTSNSLIAISEWVANSWERAGFPKKRICLIPNGVQSDSFRPITGESKQHLRMKLGLPLDCRVVLWVGRLHRQTKGLDRLLAVASLLECPFHLVVVGDGQDRPWLEARMRQSSRTQSTYTLVGNVSDPSPFYRTADLFLFTSLIEPFGLVILEAAASRLPIFAFCCKGGGLELLHKCKATVAGDHEVAALVNQMRSPPDPVRLADISEMVDRDFSWGAAASKAIKMYHELLAVPEPY